MRYIKFIILIVLIILIGTIDFFRELNNLNHSKKIIHDLKAVVLQDKNKRPMSKVIDKNKMTDNFLALIETSGLSLNFLSVSEQSIDIVLSGSFEKIQILFNSMSSQCLPFLIDYSEMSKSLEKKGDIKLRLKLNILSYCLKTKEFSRANIFVPKLKNKENYSVKQLGLAGFIKYPDHLAAVVMLPSRESKEVVVGDLLGIEQAKIISIDEEHILVELNGKNILIKKE